MEVSETHLRPPLVSLLLILIFYAYLCSDFYHKFPLAGQQQPPLYTLNVNVGSAVAEPSLLMGRNITVPAAASPPQGLPLDLNVTTQRLNPNTTAPAEQTVLNSTVAPNCGSSTSRQDCLSKVAKATAKQKTINATVLNTSESTKAGEASEVSNTKSLNNSAQVPTGKNDNLPGKTSKVPNNALAKDGKRTDDAISSQGESSKLSNNSVVKNDPHTPLITNNSLADPPPSNKSAVSVSQHCNIYHGKWVPDDSYPLYRPASCPFIDTSFRCQENGRPDSLYTNWRWQPFDCDIPRMNATDLLERLSGKRLLIVGDSLARNQFESLICILYASLRNKNGFLETNEGGYTTFNFLDSNSTIQYCRSNFLVEDEEDTLRLDKIDRYYKNWANAHVIIFNTGHWWTHTKTKTGQNYFQEGKHVYAELNVLVAYMKALKTWGRWVDRHVDPTQTQVYFRGYSPSHFWGGQWNSGGQCHEERQPIYNDTYLTGYFDGYPDKLRIVEKTLQQMKTPVILLNVTRLSDYRKDAHPSIYRFKNPKRDGFQDCSHWCLPGLPDIWNELMYASLLMSKFFV